MAISGVPLWEGSSSMATSSPWGSSKTEPWISSLACMSLSVNGCCLGGKPKQLCWPIPHSLPQVCQLPSIVSISFGVVSVALASASLTPLWARACSIWPSLLLYSLTHSGGAVWMVMVCSILLIAWVAFQLQLYHLSWVFLWILPVCQKWQQNSPPLAVPQT